jgi:hypothetical protein
LERSEEPHRVSRPLRTGRSQPPQDTFDHRLLSGRLIFGALPGRPGQIDLSVKLPPALRRPEANPRNVQSIHQPRRQRGYPHPRPPPRRRIKSNTIAPIMALIRRATIAAPRRIFRRGNSPFTDESTTRNRASHHLSCQPTGNEPNRNNDQQALIRKMHGLFCMACFSQNRKCRRLPNHSVSNMRKGLARPTSDRVIFGNDDQAARVGLSSKTSSSANGKVGAQACYPRNDPSFPITTGHIGENLSSEVVSPKMMRCLLETLHFKVPQKTSDKPALDPGGLRTVSPMRTTPLVVRPPTRTVSLDVVR